MRKINYDNISGKTKDAFCFFKPMELKLIKILVHLVPSFIETYHLTLFAIPFSIAIIISSIFAKNNINWLWFNSILILFQYLTDILDGKVGRVRNTGLVKWGFYMDHFLDFIFTCSIIIGYLIIFPENFIIFSILIAITAGIFIHELLLCSVLGKYNVAGYYGIGGTEARFFLILINTFIIIFGSAKVREISIVALFLLFLFLVKGVYKNQKLFWSIDMRNKKRLLKKCKKEEDLEDLKKQ